MNRDRRTRTQRACRPRQGARRIGGAWAVDDRWKGIASVPRSVAADSLLDFGVLFGATEGPTEPRVLVGGNPEPADEVPDGEAG